MSPELMQPKCVLDEDPVVFSENKHGSLMREEAEQTQKTSVSINTHACFLQLHCPQGWPLAGLFDLSCR